MSTEHDDSASQSEGDTSPLRRSSRVSALRAVQRLRTDAKILDFCAANEENDISPSKCHSERVGIEPMRKKRDSKNRKRRLAIHAKLDPTDPHFIIQQTDDGQVVVLSDDSEVSSLNEPELSFIRKNYEKLVRSELTPEQVRERKNMIRRLQAELRVEEAKLVLLKKMKLSQQTPIQPTKEAPHTNHINSQQNRLAASSQGGVPPPLMRAQSGTQANGPGANVGSGGYRAPIAPPPHGNRLNTIQQQASGNSNSAKTATPPPLHGAAVNVTNVVGRNVRPSIDPAALATLGANRPTTNMSPAQMQQFGGKVRPPVDSQTAEQRQMAAKSNLRKQLEKTLLQIPPPKPPPPEMNFIPNPNQLDFLGVVGLDYCVQRLTEQQCRKKERERKKELTEAAKESKGKLAEIEAKPEPAKVTEVADVQPPDAWECAQCVTDFTPYWKMSETKAGQEAVMCESCIRSNQKKALKAEHTNRLKQAFVTALQKEQEIEQQIKNSPASQTASPKLVVSQKPAISSGSMNHSSAVSALNNASSNTSSSMRTTQQQHNAAVAAAHQVAAAQQQQQQQAAAGLNAAAAVSNQAATAAALLASVGNPAGFAANMGGLTPQQFLAMGMNMNPFLAAAAASRANLPMAANLSQDLLRNFQQQSQFSTAAQLEMQRLLSMLPKTQWPHTSK